MKIMLKNLIPLLLIVFLCGCKTQTKQETKKIIKVDNVKIDDVKEQIIISSWGDTTILRERQYPNIEDSTAGDTVSGNSNRCIPKDSTTPLGTKIHYISKNGKHKISWGDKTYNRTYDSLYACYYNCRSFFNFVPKLIFETKNSLVFKNVLWTSSSCAPFALRYYAIILPKNNTDLAISKESILTYGEGYIAYFEDSDRLHIMNVETKKIQTIMLDPYVTPHRVPSFDEITIKNKNIFFTYTAASSTVATVTRTVKIER